ncbi:hypothetical protein OG874_22205 [Nocardia sp. NBC_00565]|nr:hypothetical protein [Nocardia sp. NBC_00565]WUC07631.1 hypothetical protein OG874_22205 [Nocardia sp. NBC_00565]
MGAAAILPMMTTAPEQQLAHECAWSWSPMSADVTGAEFTGRYAALPA